MQLDSAAINHLTARVGVVPHWYLWVTARNRSTGLDETIGIWTGRRDVSLTVEGASRTYTRAGALMQVGPITFEPGPVVRRQTVTLSPLSTQVTDMIRTYDARLAKADLHLGMHDPESGDLVSIPRVFRGVIDKAPVVTPAKGGMSTVQVTMVSNARDMTRKLALKRSDESQRLRSDDRFRRYASVSGSVGVWWGEERS